MERVPDANIFFDVKPVTPKDPQFKYQLVSKSNFRQNSSLYSLLGSAESASNPQRGAK